MKNKFSEFKDSGLCVVPLKSGVPLVEWSRYFFELPNGEVDSWHGNEYALVCGAVSDVIAIDIDTDEGASRIYQLAGETPVRKQGSKGFTAFYKFNGEKSGSWKKDGQVIVELLSDKRLTTIPPSPHRKTGKPYVWLERDLMGAELPTLSPDFITLMDALYPKPQRVVISPVRYDKDDIRLDEVADALDYISSDVPRDEWITIGMALRDEFGDAACDLWHRWSAKAGARYNHNDAQSCWRSFTSDGYTIGTIIHKAKQSGWIQRVEIVSSFDVSLEYGAVKKTKEKSKTLQVHGLVGEIADWITSTAVRPQPVLSLAAALAFVGMLKGHRVCGTTDLRTNLLVLSLCPSTGGKDHPQNCLKRLIRECELELNLVGEPASGAGFLRSINDSGRVALWVKDELGRYIGKINGKNAGGWEREVMDYMIQLFSCANNLFKGKEYADKKNNPTLNLYHPHFCCIGSTVEEKLRDACSSAEVLDGFLNRWVVMATKIRPKRRKDVRFSPPPQAIVDKIKALPVRQYSPYTGEPLLSEMRFAKDAWGRFSAYQDEVDDRLDAATYPINALYGRLAEHAEKIALTIAEGDEIKLHDVEAAISVVEFSTSCILEFAGLISDNQTEAEYVRVREIVRKAGLISRSALIRCTQFVSSGAKRRNEILGDLVESGQVAVEKVGNSNYFKWIE